MASLDRGDWFRLFLGFFAALIFVLDFIASSFVTPFISELFYPSADYAKSLVVVFGAFFAGAAIRPIAGVFLGPYGDRVGRKKLTEVSMIGVGIFTIGIGLLPVYKTVGISAVFLLILFTVLQGFFVAGIAGAYTIGVESFKEHFRGALTGVTQSSGALGHFAGSGIFIITSVIFTGASYLTLGWRFMFIIPGILAFIIVAYTHWLVPESTTYEMASKSKRVAKSPLKEFFAKENNPRNSYFVIISAIGMLSLVSVISLYPTYLVVSVKLSKALIGEVTIIGALVGFAATLFGGLLLHFNSAKKIGIVIAVLMIPISVVAYYVGHLSIAYLPYVILGSSLVYFLHYVVLPIQNLFMVESFRTNVRSTGFSLSWNLSYLVGGGIPTLVSYGLVVYGDKSFPVLMMAVILVLAIVSLIGTAGARNSRGDVQKEINEMASEIGDF